MDISYDVKMQVAEILSDLTSLQVCVRPKLSPSLKPPSNTPQDPAAALTLVSVRPGPSNDEQNSLSAATTRDDDADLKRAKDLLQLHATVKVAHQDGTDHELIRARKDVERVMQGLR